MAELDLQNYQNRHSLKSKIGRVVWNVVWTMFSKWTPEHSRLFNKWRVLLLKLFGANVGKGCVVKSSCEVWQPWNLTMGDYATISHNVDCYNVAPIMLGNNVSVSQGVSCAPKFHFLPFHSCGVHVRGMCGILV